MRNPEVEEVATVTGAALEAVTDGRDPDRTRDPGPVAAIAIVAAPSPLPVIAMTATTAVSPNRHVVETTTAAGPIRATATNRWMTKKTPAEMKTARQTEMTVDLGLDPGPDPVQHRDPSLVLDPGLHRRKPMINCQAYKAMFPFYTHNYVYWTFFSWMHHSNISFFARIAMQWLCTNDRYYEYDEYCIKCSCVNTVINFGYSVINVLPFGAKLRCFAIRGKEQK